MMRDLYLWAISLPPDFAFLMSLPILVAITGLLGDWWRRRRKSARRSSGRADAHARGDSVRPPA